MQFDVLGQLEARPTEGNEDAIVKLRLAKKILGRAYAFAPGTDTAFATNINRGDTLRRAAARGVQDWRRHELRQQEAAEYAAELAAAGDDLDDRLADLAWDSARAALQQDGFEVDW